MQVSGGRYSLNQNASSELHKALYDKIYSNEILLRDETPQILLQQKGVKSLPMVMQISHIRENVFSETEAFIQQSLENGGMVEKPKSQTAVKKADTEAKLKAKVDELKEDNERLEREARVSERKAKTAEKREAATSERMESEKAKEVKRIATSVKRLVNDFSFLVNEATHRKYTVGGAVGATILADPAIQAFAAYFAKRGSAYSIMNKSTRDGVKRINIVSRPLLVFSIKLPYSV